MSTTTIELDEKIYGQLLRRTLRHVIRTDEENERLAAEKVKSTENAERIAKNRSTKTWSVECKNCSY